MIERADYEQIQKTLVDCLQPFFDDAAVEVGDDIYYKGVNIVVTSRHFTGLLAEQRFHHVVRAIPQNLYNDRLRRGIVWFELAPGETGQDLMRMPRAEDVRKDDAAIESKLREAGFFSAIRARFAEAKDQPSVMRFDASRELLSTCGIPAAEVESAVLFLIGRGAYCDAHVANDLAPRLLSESAA